MDSSAKSTFELHPSSTERESLPMPVKRLTNRRSHTRPIMGRMLCIHQQISSGSFPNCSHIARLLTVSTKTVQRDIDFMRDRLNIPIEYDSEKHGYYYAESVAPFPMLQISEGELVALLVAQQAMEQYRGTPYEAPLRIAFEKLSASLPNEISLTWDDLSSAVSFRSLGAAQVPLVVFETASKAVIKKLELTFQYKKVNAPRYEKRHVHPYHILCVQNQWYLFAFDLKRKAIRRFVLNRMKSLKLSKNHFTKPKDFDIQELLRNSFGVFSREQEPQLIRLRFDEFSAQFIRHRTWHTSQEIVELKDGSLELSLTLDSTEEIIRWILGWSWHVQVLTPASLAEQVNQAHLQATQQSFSSQSNPKLSKEESL